MWSTNVSNSPKKKAKRQTKRTTINAVCAPKCLCVFVMERTRRRMWRFKHCNVTTTDNSFVHLWIIHVRLSVCTHIHIVTGFVYVMLERDKDVDESNNHNIFIEWPTNSNAFIITWTKAKVSLRHFESR